MSELDARIEEIDEQPTACVFDVVGHEQMGPALGRMLPRVAAWLDAGHGQMAGPPYARYHAGPEGKFDVEAGCPVSAPVVGDDEVRAGTLPAGRVAVISHVGPYERLPQTHQAAESWLADNGETEAGARWEVYVTDPMEQPDSALWETLIYIPLKPKDA
jgi:effector-binding domain-containing protein